MKTSCKNEVEPFFAEMNEAAKRTLETNMEAGFTIGVSPDGDYKIAHGADGYFGLTLKRPEPPYRPFLHFHTHVKQDVVKGLSGGDTAFPFFKEETYPFHCVASTGYSKIYCFRPEDVVKHPEYKKRITEHEDLSMEHAKIITRSKRHYKTISNLLEKNKIMEVIKYERRHLPEAARIMRQMMINWNDFIQKTKCAEFNIH